MNNKIIIFVMSNIFFYGYVNNVNNIMLIGFTLTIIFCAFKDFKFEDMKEKNEENKNKFKIMLEEYKNLELGVKNNAFRH